VGLFCALGSTFRRLTSLARESRLIKYNAMQIAPAELEDLLMKHPDIADACVIGIPDPAA
jgi:acyl-coenzyme A synthetase/AMP-(fatty) acid ligase